MDKPSEMTTSSSVMEKLRLKRQDNEFVMTEEGFTAGKGKFYLPDELKIIKTFRFEGDSNPDDSSIIYLIEANDGLIGYSMDAYGVYSNHDDEGKYDEFIRQIPKRRQGRAIDPGIAAFLDVKKPLINVNGFFVVGNPCNTDSPGRA